MKVTFPLDGAAPTWAHAHARDVERAFAKALAAPQAGPFTYKSDIIDRMSDDQLNTFDTLLNQTTPRMRLLWGAIQAVYHRSEGFPLLYAFFFEEFGTEETNRILKASGSA